MTPNPNPIPQGFICRWITQATTPDLHPCTTTFDLTETRTHVLVQPSTIDNLSLLIDTDAIRVLLETVNTNTACAVPADHPNTHGPYLLGLRPHDPNWTNTPPHPGPLTLYIRLPTTEIQILYRDAHLTRLRDTLAEIHYSMTH
jgi:hypothetical protein